jgi:hypothetical protein
LNATIAVGSEDGGSGSGGHADAAAGGGIAGASFASGVMHREGGAALVDATAAALGASFGAVLVDAMGAGSGGVREQPAARSAQIKKNGTASRLGGGEASTRCRPPLSECRANRQTPEIP